MPSTFFPSPRPWIDPPSAPLLIRSRPIIWPPYPNVVHFSYSPDSNLVSWIDCRLNPQVCLPHSPTTQHRRRRRRGQQADRTHRTPSSPTAHNSQSRRSHQIPRKAVSTLPCRETILPDSEPLRIPPYTPCFDALEARKLYNIVTHHRATPDLKQQDTIEAAIAPQQQRVVSLSVTSPTNNYFSRRLRHQQQQHS